MRNERSATDCETISGMIHRNAVFSRHDSYAIAKETTACVRKYVRTYVYLRSWRIAYRVAAVAAIRAVSACVHLVYNCGAYHTHDLYKMDMSAYLAV